MAEQIAPVIPAKNPKTKKDWQRGDTYQVFDETAKMGVVYQLGVDGWEAKPTSEAAQRIIDAAVESTVTSSKTGIPVGQPTTKDAYDLTIEPQYRLYKLTPQVRDKILKELYVRGQYGSSKMQNGTGPADISAFGDLLYYANSKGKSWEQAFELYKKEFPIKTSLSAGVSRRAPRQVSSPDDLKAVFKKASQELLGMTPDSKLADHFVSTFQNQQIEAQNKLATQSGGTVAQAPDAGVVAEKMITQQYGGEVRVQRATNFGNIMDQMIKGLAR